MTTEQIIKDLPQFTDTELIEDNDKKEVLSKYLENVIQDINHYIDFDMITLKDGTNIIVDTPYLIKDLDILNAIKTEFDIK